MYEKMNGSARLVGALENACTNPATAAALAELLYYCGDQLPEDVRALSDVQQDAAASDRSDNPDNRQAAVQLAALVHSLRSLCQTYQQQADMLGDTPGGLLMDAAADKLAAIVANYL